MRVLVLGTLLAGCAVAGCATITTDPAVPAFSNAVKAGTRAFATARAAENEAFAQAALNAALTDGSVSTENCWQPNADQSKCQLVITVDGQPVNQQAVATNGARLVQALAIYAHGLAQLAEAKDIVDQQTAVGTLASGIAQIASLLHIPGVSQAGSVIAEIHKDIAMKHRQAQLLTIVQHYESTIDAAANLLQSETELLQKNVVINAAQTVEHEQVLLATVPPEQRFTVAENLVTAVTAEQQAASLKITLASQLKAANAALITSLQNPKADHTAALNDIKSLAGGFSSMEAAFRGTATTSTNGGKSHG